MFGVPFSITLMDRIPAVIQCVQGPPELEAVPCWLSVVTHHVTHGVNN